MVCKRVFLVIGLLVLCGALLFGIEWLRPYKVGTVRIISNGTEYTPMENWLYSVSDGICADGFALWPQDVADKLTAIPYADEFKIVIKGRDAMNVRYTLYDDKYERVYSSMEAFSLPAKQGEYILDVFVSWGHCFTNNCAGGQHLFKISNKK